MREWLIIKPVDCVMGQGYEMVDLSQRYQATKRRLSFPGVSPVAGMRRPVGATRFRGFGTINRALRQI